MKIYILILFCLPFLFFSSESVGQSNVDFDIFSYRSVGPIRGGRVTAVHGVSAQSNIFYMGSTGGGLWKSEDYGVKWKNISDGYFDSPSIGAIAVSETNPSLLYVGTGSDGLRSNVITGKGIYKSHDAGNTWNFVGLKAVGQIGAVEISPVDDSSVLVAAIGNAFGPNPERGIFKTSDGGQNWKQVLYISDTTGICDLEYNPSDPKIVYAAAWRAERKPWTIISGGKENGIYKSLDGGDTWTRASNGLPELMGKIDLAVCPEAPNLVYALVEARDNKGGLYKSEDYGENYTQISSKKGLRTRPFYYTNVEVDPTNPDIVYVLATRYYKSEDGGKSWKQLYTPHGDHHDLWINPKDPQLQIQSNDGGANITHNGGLTWSSQHNQSTAEIYQVEVDNQYPYWLYGGQQDNYSTVSVPSLPPSGHQAGGLGFVMNAGGCETGPAVPHPTNANIVYSNCKGRFSVYNKKTGQEKRYDVGAAYMYGHNPKDLEYRFQRVSPIHISPHDSKLIYHASQYVHVSTNEGKTWKTISPDLTAFDDATQVISGGPITRDITGEEFYSTIYSLRESTLEKGVIWVGANDGPVHVTLNAGKSWEKVTPMRLLAGGRVDCVEPSSHKKGTAYISVLRYQLGDWRPYIFKTKDYGSNWTLITQGIPEDYPVRVVREDPVQPGLLYAGTEFGIFVSFDDGENWLPFQQNLPITPITDMKLHRGDLVISTMGRGFYILDNLSALREDYLQNFESEKVRLYSPKSGIRYRYPSFNDRRLPAPSPIYPRPTLMIDYFLPEESADGLTIEIYDAMGQLVNAYQSWEKQDTIMTKRNMSTEEWTYLFNSNLTHTKGMNRFYWDMRHRGAWHKNKKRSFEKGPVAAPGKYKAVLKVNDQEYSTSFSLEADPRILESGVTIEELNMQVELSLKITDLLSRSRMRAEAIEKELAVISKADPKWTSLNEMKSQLVREKGVYTETRFINQIEYLLGLIKDRDQAPGDEVVSRYEELNNIFETKFK